MRLALAALLTTTLCALPNPGVVAASCMTAAEFDNVDRGDTRSHVENDIFDGYHGTLVNAFVNDGFVWRLKAYMYCGTGAETILYRRPANTNDPFRVFSMSS